MYLMVKDILWLLLTAYPPVKRHQCLCIHLTVCVYDHTLIKSQLACSPAVGDLSKHTKVRGCEKLPKLIIYRDTVNPLLITGTYSTGCPLVYTPAINTAEAHMG